MTHKLMIFKQDQHTPLHDAAANGHVEVIEELIKSGADVNSVQKVTAKNRLP